MRAYHYLEGFNLVDSNSPFTTEFYNCIERLLHVGLCFLEAFASGEEFDIVSELGKVSVQCCWCWYAGHVQKEENCTKCASLWKAKVYGNFTRLYVRV